MCYILSSSNLAILKQESEETDDILGLAWFCYLSRRICLSCLKLEKGFTGASESSHSLFVKDYIAFLLRV